MWNTFWDLPNKSIIQYSNKKHLVRKVAQMHKRSVVATSQLYKFRLYVKTQSQAFVLAIASLNVLRRMFFENQWGASKNGVRVSTSVHQNVERQGCK